MKSIKYFAALAFPAMFAACANEEIQIEAPQTMQEVVGAEFIGTDISMVASKGSIDSRFAGGENGFGKSDKLGLGWVTVTGPSTPQVENGVLDERSRLYANHLFEYVEGATNTFTTKSNIYKGYHFAYYPYAYMEEVGPKTIEISPKQEVGYVDGEAATAYNLRLAQQFQMSAFQFLDKKSLDPETYQLKREFQMKTPLSQLIVKTTAEGSFATNANLKGYQIKSVTFNLGKEVFAHSAKLDLTKLFKLGTNPQPDMTLPQANEQGLVNSFAQVLCPTYPTTTTTAGETTVVWNDGRNASAKTEIAVESYIVSAKNPRLMTFVLPMNAATSFTDEEKKAVSIEIEAGGGKFVVDYTDGAVEGTAAYKNNQALAQLVAAYETNGKFVGKYNQQETLNVILTEADFVADFTGVTNENWAEKVQLANDLNRGVEEFVLAKGANVIFTGNNLDAEGKPLAPTAGVKVSTVDNNNNPDDGTLTIGALNAVTEWNDNINVNDGRVSLTVAEGAALKVVGTLTPSRFYNYGTIYAGPLSEVGKKHEAYGNFLYNYNRVEVEYGAYVNVKSENKGTIAYVLTSADVENPSQIKEMIATTGNQHGHANVNTIVVGNTIDIDLYKNVYGSTGSTEEGRYNDEVTPGVGTTGAAWVEDLSKVNFEINGGKVKASFAPVTVANVTMNGGSLTNVIVKGAFTATGDVQVAAPSIEGNVTVTGTTEAQIAVSGEIKGNVTATNATVSAKTITGAVVAEDAEITAETITGDVTLKGESAINGAEITGDVTVENGTAILNDVTINGDLFNKGTVTINAEDLVSINNIDNKGNLTANTDVIVKTIITYKGCTTTVNEDNDNVIWFTVPKAEGGYVQAGTTTGRIEFYGNAQFLEDVANAENGATVVLKSDVELSEVLTIAAGKTLTIDLNGKTLANSTSSVAQQEDIVVTGDLTIKNGTINSNNQPLWVNGGNLTLENCTVTSTATNLGAPLLTANNATVNIQGGSFTGETCDGHDNYMIGIKAGSNATINTTVSGGNGAVTVTGGSTADITGGSYEGTKACGLYIDGSTVDYIDTAIFSGVEGDVVVGVISGNNSTVNGTTYSSYTKIIE